MKKEMKPTLVNALVTEIDEKLQNISRAEAEKIEKNIKSDSLYLEIQKLQKTKDTIENQIKKNKEKLIQKYNKDGKSNISFSYYNSIPEVSRTAASKEKIKSLVVLSTLDNKSTEEIITQLVNKLK